MSQGLAMKSFIEQVTPRAGCSRKAYKAIIEMSLLSFFSIEGLISSFKAVNDIYSLASSATQLIASGWAYYWLFIKYLQLWLKT